MRYGSCSSPCLTHDFEHHALFEAGAAVEVCGKFLDGLVDLKLCHEADSAHVDADQRNAIFGDGAYYSQDRAVATGDDDEAGVVQDVTHGVQVFDGAHPAVFAQFERAHDGLSHLERGGVLRVVHEAD